MSLKWRLCKHAVAKMNVTPFDPKRRNHEAVIEALRTALKQCGDRNIDGALIILASDNGKKTVVTAAGSLNEDSRLAYHASRLHIGAALGI